MKTGDEIRILVCNTDAFSNIKLEQVLSSHQLKNVLMPADAKYLKWMVAAHKPDLIFTDNNLWEEYDAVNLIRELREANNTPVVIWTNRVSEKIIAAVFNINYVYYIKKTDDSSMLLDAIRKAIAPQANYH